MAPNNINRVGLAVSPYNLSVSKINRINSECDLLDNFYLGSYRLKVYNSTDLVLFCGQDVLEPALSIETKYVRVGNSLGNITLELW